MNSLDKMAELAGIFEMKLSRAEGSTHEEDVKAPVSDAFFGVPADHEGNVHFKEFIGKEGSALLTAMKEIWSAINKSFDVNIGATVNATNKTASFIVATVPDLPGPYKDKIKKALNVDFLTFYKKSPEEKFKARLAAGKIQPPDINLSHPTIITGIGIG